MDITRTALRAIVESSRTLADELEQLLALADSDALIGSQTDAPASEGHGDDRVVWDPENDAPLVTPKVTGTREEKDWCSLTYLGGIYAINKRHTRGATKEEVRHFAVKAGYRDGRAVTAWSKGNGATQNDADKQRWVSQNGVRWVNRLMGTLGLSLPADLADPWEAPRFH